MEKILYVVAPCFNESAVLPETSKRLQQKLNSLIKIRKISQDSRILLVDDGSKDDTWHQIEQLHKRFKMFSGIKLSRNRGHQNALLAGLMTAKEKADLVISIDADLQDDIDAIDIMLEEHDRGADIVYGVRSSRKKDSLLKRNSALLFYKIMLKMGVDSIYNHADYRLMTRRALNDLENFREVNLFLRGMVPLIGYSSSIVEYDRSERFAGESKYPFRKMLNFAIDGITSFSVKPLRLVTGLGLTVSLVSLLVAIYSIAVYILGMTVSGWTFTIISVWFIGGVQMLSLGVVGEYIGKIYSEVKARPRFIIEKSI